jgi:hypothetical protein
MLTGGEDKVRITVIDAKKAKTTAKRLKRAFCNKVLGFCNMF